MPDDEPPRLRPYHAPNTSERGQAASSVVSQLAAGLPANLRRQFEGANRWQTGDDPNQWASRAYGIVRLITDPKRTLDALVNQTKPHHESPTSRPT